VQTDDFSRRAEVGQEHRDRLARHRAAAIGVHGQLIPGDQLVLAGLGDQRLGDQAGLAVLDSPADGVAAEHVEDHVQVEVRPLRGAEQLGDVPRPELVRPLREQLRLGVARVDELVAPLPHAAVPGGQQPVHRPLRGEVLALIEQRGIHLRGRAVDEPP
jgi:hypothetical protein